ncbi:MAG: zinc-dependent metalloprotease [Bacteroidota bacterium]
MIRSLICFCLSLAFYTLAAQPAAGPLPTISEYTKDMEARPGFFPVYWDAQKGRILLEIANWETDFLYVNSLAAGLGSNDIGLDRNQLGNDRVVRFERSGPQVLLIQRNLDFRAVSDNPQERQAVAEAFAESVLFGGKALAITEDAVLIDLTPLLMQDEHGVAQRLKVRKQGSYKLALNRSAVYLENTRNFPQNSEFEALLTFIGDPSGAEVRSVVPSPRAISLRQHHSFVQLPELDYQPRRFDPRSGYFSFSYADYATPIEQPLQQRFITRHRLEKKDPRAARSEAVEPIVYYLDRGTPEPIRSALLEGARWWNEAFEAAGYIDAFRVEVLPDGADPLDVRYNMINWVHRSTRGWSYGSSVVDPRTGEILKGHVLLGSLRVRQDFLLAQGLIEGYANSPDPDPRLLEMALARLRQLSAHEVGHTLGLAHNFAASTNGRASVMDYPHPLIELLADGSISTENAYDVGIGDWDKRAIIYGYLDLRGQDEAKALTEVIAENEALGLRYLSDNDARSLGTANPYAHLWDNGPDPIAELERLGQLRRHALDNLSSGHIAPGRPVASLENVLVPVYLMQRYQVEAVAKLIGGYEYEYSVRSLSTSVDQTLVQAVSFQRQEAALSSLLATLDPQYLQLPVELMGQLPPQPQGYRRDRELFRFYTGATFDPLAAALTSADLSLRLLLHPERLARLQVTAAQTNNGQHRCGPYLNRIYQSLIPALSATDVSSQMIGEMVFYRFLQHLFSLTVNPATQTSVRADVLALVQAVATSTPGRRAYQGYLREEVRRFQEQDGDYSLPPAPRTPDGSPIGCGENH